MTVTPRGRYSIAQRHPARSPSRPVGQHADAKTAVTVEVNHEDSDFTEESASAPQRQSAAQVTWIRGVPGGSLRVCRNTTYHRSENRIPLSAPCRDLELVDRHRNEQDDAAHQILVESVDILQIHRVFDGAHDQHTDDDAADRGAATRQRDAAE